MKKLFFLLIIFFMGVSQVNALAWMGIDDFDSYTADATLNGANGGSGWSGAWSSSANDEVITPVAPTGMSGKAMKSLLVAGDGGSTNRTLTTSINPTTSGEIILSYQMMAEQTNQPFRFGPGEVGVASRINIYAQNDGNLHAIGATDVNLGAYTANTVYRILVKIGHVSGKAAVSVNGGAYSSDIQLSGSSPYTITGVFSAMEGSGVFWIDDIKDGAAAEPSPTPPSFLSLVRAFWIF